MASLRSSVSSTTLETTVLPEPASMSSCAANAAEAGSATNSFAAAEDST